MQRSPSAVFGLLACALGFFSSAGCTPLELTRTSDADGKVTARYYYENGWPWSAREVVSSPPAEELRDKLLAIVPLGSPRPVVLRRLNAAGIQGNFRTQSKVGGGSAPRHDCFSSRVWKRPDGKVWLVNISFYFDEFGKLHRIEFSPDPGLRPDGTERGNNEVIPTETIETDKPRPRRGRQQCASDDSDLEKQESRSSKPSD
jgi:hypothetical protein